MSTIEILYAFFVAIFALHFSFVWDFARNTPKGTKFSISYWFKKNTFRYFFAWMGMVMWLLLVQWDDVFAAYGKYVLSEYPILEVLKAHAVVAFLAGFFNTKLFVYLAKKTEERVSK
jgi:hypothetical protein